MLKQRRKLYVNPRTGDDAYTGLSGSKAKRTLKHVAQIVTPGDTVILADGIYDERLLPTRSGSPEAPITFRSLNRHSARIRETSGYSQSFLIDISNAHHLRFEGLWIKSDISLLQSGRSGAQRALRASNCSNITVEDCLFEEFGPAAGELAVHFLQCIDVVFRNNVVRRQRGTSQGANMVTFDACSRVLAEANAFGEALHEPCLFRGGSNFAIRGNVFFAGWGRPVSTIGTAVPPQPISNILFENNLVCHGYDGARCARADGKLLGVNVIARHNLFLESWAGAIQLYAWNEKDAALRHARFYNNAGIGNRLWTFWPGDALKNASEDIRFINNLFVDNDEMNGMYSIYWHGVQQPSQQAEYKIARNALFSSSGRIPVLSFGEGGDRIPMVSSANLAKASPSDNVTGDPALVDSALWNVAASQRSYLRNNGVPLASAVGKGKGAVIKVSDTHAFYDGYAGMLGEKGDIIAVGSPQQQARVLECCHDSGTLVLDRHVEWSDGDPVSLAWERSAPDIGPIEHGGSARPSILVIASARRIAPGDTVDFSLLCHGFAPKAATWFIGDKVVETGLRVRHCFGAEREHPIRVRVTASSGETYWGVYLITCRSPKPPGAPLLTCSFDEANDREYWWRFKTYKPSPAAEAASLLDPDLGRHVYEITARKGGQMPCALYPEHWDSSEYPILSFKYKCAPDVPLTLTLVHFATSPMSGKRSAIIAGTAAARPATTSHVLLQANNVWQDARFDIYREVLARWGGQTPPIVRGLEFGCRREFGCQGTVTDGMTYRLADVRITKT